MDAFRATAGSASRLEEVRLLPSGGGRYEITLDGRLVYSKAETGQHIATEDAGRLVRQALG